MPAQLPKKSHIAQNMDRIRVLHVDDDLALLEIAKEILETDTQLEVHSVLSAEEAFKKISQEEFDVIVSDYQMPEKDGLEFLKELRAKEDATPFIIFTGKGREEIVIQALNAGATYYLNKQGSPETVYGELTHAIMTASKAGKAENALKESEAKYRELINGMNDTVWVIDFEGNFIDVNDTSLRVLGYSRDELLSLGIRGIDKHLSREKVQELLNRLPAVGTQVFETEHTTKAGQTIPVEISSSLVTYQGKQAILSIARNITKRKKAEQMLRENEERLRLKLDSVLSPGVDIEEQELSNIIDAPKLQVMMDDLYAVTKMVFAILDLKGNVLVKTGWKDICTKFHRVNPQTCKNCVESDLELSKGVKQGEYRLYKCKNNMWDIVTPLIMNGKHIGNIYSGQFFFEDEEINRDLFASQAEKYGFDKEEYLSAFDRVPRYSREKIQKFMLFNTKLSEMISKLSYSNLKIAKALSDQKTIERTIRANEQRWATTLSSIGDAVIATDEKGKVTFMNSVAEHLTGWNLFEASQKPLKQVFCIVNEENHEPVENPVDRVLKEGVVVGLANHTVLLCKDGKEVPIADSGAPIRDEKGNITGVVLVFRDITERKKAEAALIVSEKRLRFIADNLPGIVWITDANLRFIGSIRSCVERFWVETKSNSRYARK